MRGEKKRVMVFRIPEQIADPFAEETAKEFKTMTAVVVEMMRDYLEARRVKVVKSAKYERELKIIEQRAKPVSYDLAPISPLKVNSGKSKVILDRLLKKHPAVLTPRYRGAIEGSITNDIDILDALDPLYLESAGDDALEAEYDAFQTALMDVLNDQDD